MWILDRDYGWDYGGENDGEINLYEGPHRWVVWGMLSLIISHLKLMNEIGEL